MGYIYLITNTENGMQYVGQTQQEDIHDRWNAHKRVSPTNIGRYLYSAYKKYGINKFKFQIICICFNEDCDRYEEDYIKKYNTLAPKGYNLQTGGKSTKFSEETRQLMSRRQKELMTDDKRKEISERNKGKIISESQRHALSISQKERWKNMSSEEKNKLIEKRKNNTNYENARNALLKGSAANKKRVGQYDINNNLLESFDSITHASKSTNICHSTISKVCLQKPKYKTTGGFIWKFI